MQTLARQDVSSSYIDLGTRWLDHRLSAAVVWYGGAAAMLAGILAGIATLAELMPGLIF